MQNLKFLIPVLFVLVSGCKILTKQAKEEYKTGLISLKEVKHYKWFNREYRNYHFTKTIADSLSSLRNFNITIMGGEWCSDTKLYLPQFIKILETLQFPEENLKIIFVDRTKQKPLGFDNSFESLNLKFIPTFIVFDKMGKEKGRIVEAPAKTLEQDLLKIINLP